MNIFVTGGAGYIGSATAEALLKAGHSVTIYDSLVTGHRQAVPKGAHFIHASLEDSHALAESLTREKFDAVMHFAAFIEAGESMKHPGRFYQNNLVNSLHLIETAMGAGVKRFVLSSTAAVYKSSDEPLTEEFAAWVQLTFTGTPNWSLSKHWTGTGKSTACTTRRCAISTPVARRLNVARRTNRNRT